MLYSYRGVEFEDCRAKEVLISVALSAELLLNEDLARCDGGPLVKITVMFSLYGSPVNGRSVGDALPGGSSPRRNVFGVYFSREHYP